MKKKPFSRVHISIHAGVHINTVHAYYNGMNVSDESKAAILAAVNKLERMHGIAQKSA